jgi:hypothetical protein
MQSQCAATSVKSTADGRSIEERSVPTLTLATVKICSTEKVEG